MKFFLSLALCCASALTAYTQDSLPSRVYNWNSLKTVTEVSGTKKIVMEGSTTSLAHFEVHVTTLEPGKKQKANNNNGRETLIILKEGQVKITLNGINKTLGTGSVAFAIPGDNYTIENPGTTNATYYVFYYGSKLPANMERAKQNGGSFIIAWNDMPVEKTDKGHRRAFFNKPTSQLEKLEMHTTALEAGFDSHAPHTHKEEEIILLLKGNVEMFIAGNLYKAAPGAVVFLSSGVSHALKNTGKEQCEYFAFQWRN